MNMLLLKILLVFFFLESNITKKIYIEPLFNKLSINNVDLTFPKKQIKNSSNMKELFINKIDKIPIRILSNELLEKTNDLDNAKIKCKDTILIHIHGGGFVANTSRSHLCYIIQ